VLTPIPAQELKDWLDESHSFRLIDARSPEEFAAGHIPTAIAIHSRSQKKPARDTFQDVPVVVYCHGSYANKLSPCFQAIVKEIQGSQRHVYWFKGGAELWRAQGFPMTEAGGPGTVKKEV
jgi:rhodanese-related sulfurtransferase